MTVMLRAEMECDGVVQFLVRYQQLAAYSVYQSRELMSHPAISMRINLNQFNATLQTITFSCFILATYYIVSHKMATRQINKYSDLCDILYNITSVVYSIRVVIWYYLCYGCKNQ